MLVTVHLAFDKSIIHIFSRLTLTSEFPTSAFRGIFVLDAGYQTINKSNIPYFRTRHHPPSEGEAEAILKVQQANADGIKFLNEAAPAQAVLTLKSLEAFTKAADGKATKLIIPSEISGIAGLASSLTEIVTKNKES